MQSTAASAVQTLEEKIKSRTARVGIIGLGYVGLPLAMEFAKAGFPVTGIDIQQSKVAQLNRGESYVQDVAAEVLGPLVEARKFHATTDFSVISESGHHQHRGSDAFAQDQGSGHELHRVRVSGDREIFRSW